MSEDFYKWSHTTFYEIMQRTYTKATGLGGVDAISKHMEWQSLMMTEKYKHLSYKDKVDIFHNSLPKEFTDRADIRNSINATYKKTIQEGDGSFPYSTVDMQNFAQKQHG